MQRECRAAQCQPGGTTATRNVLKERVATDRVAMRGRESAARVAKRGTTATVRIVRDSRGASEVSAGHA